MTNVNEITLAIMSENECVKEYSVLPVRSFSDFPSTSSFQNIRTEYVVKKKTPTGGEGEQYCECDNEAVKQRRGQHVHAHKRTLKHTHTRAHMHHNKREQRVRTKASRNERREISTPTYTAFFLCRTVHIVTHTHARTHTYGTFGEA